VQGADFVEIEANATRSLTLGARQGVSPRCAGYGVWAFDGVDWGAGGTDLPHSGQGC
jgi:hypothetical protein